MNSPTSWMPIAGVTALMCSLLSIVFSFVAIFSGYSHYHMPLIRYDGSSVQSALDAHIRQQWGNDTDYFNSNVKGVWGIEHCQITFTHVCIKSSRSGWSCAQRLPFGSFYPRDFISKTNELYTSNLFSEILDTPGMSPASFDRPASWGQNLAITYAGDMLSSDDVLDLTTPASNDQGGIIERNLTTEEQAAVWRANKAYQITSEAQSWYRWKWDFSTGAPFTIVVVASVQQILISGSLTWTKFGAKMPSRWLMILAAQSLIVALLATASAGTVTGLVSENQGIVGDPFDTEYNRFSSAVPGAMVRVRQGGNEFLVFSWLPVIFDWIAFGLILYVQREKERTLETDSLRPVMEMDQMSDEVDVVQAPRPNIARHQNIRPLRFGIS